MIENNGLIHLAAPIYADLIHFEKLLITINKKLWKIIKKCLTIFFPYDTSPVVFLKEVPRLVP
jgi:hypothetical protein